MKTDDFKTTREQLEKEIQQNNEKIIKNDERKMLLDINSFESKFWITLFFSLVGYLPLFLVSSFLIKAFGVALFTNIIPAYSFPVLLIGSSLGIGVLGKKIMYEKYKLKERLKSFSTANTENEKLKEEIYYQIELKKLKNRNLTLNETIKELNENELLLKKISGKYEICEKNDFITNENSIKKIEDLSKNIKEKYDNLDMLSSQKVLSDRFWKVRLKGQKAVDTIIYSLISGMLSMFFILIPTLMVKETIAFGSLYVGLATILAPFAVGIIGTSVYMNKRNNDQKRIFNFFNHKLKENALSKTLDEYEKKCEENKIFNSLIERQIKDISLSIVELEEQKIQFNTFSAKMKEESEFIQDLAPLEVINDSFLEHLELGDESLRPYLEENLEVDVIEEQSPILKKIKKRNIKK